MARPRKPTAVKAMQGTLRPDRVNRDEPIPDTFLDQVEPPDYLGDDAKDCWRYAVKMAPREMLTSLDFAVLATWADTQGKIMECERELQRTGLFIYDEKKGYSLPSKVLTEQTQLKMALLRCMNELGFTPASRSKVSVRKKGDDAANPFMDL